jgi:misacylated tRNA(Ala) deacylase
VKLSLATKLLYLYDSYLKEFEAKVESVSGNAVILDQSAFHPLTGGVGCDLGWLVKSEAQFRVVRVEVDRATRVVSHLLEAGTSGLSAGDSVNGLIDWDRRYCLMRLHTAAHLIAAVMYRDYSALITGGQVDVDQAKLDFNLPRTDREVFEAAVRKANEEAAKRVELKIYFLSREEALKVPGVVKLAERMPPEERELRIVEIPGIDLQADGGPHVKNTSEIGETQLLKIENKGKNQRRIYFGMRSANSC